MCWQNDMDKIVKALAYDNAVQISLIDGKNMLEKAQQLHKTSPLATVAMGRLLMIASLMSADLKNDTDKISVSMKGDGPLGTIIVAGDCKGNVRCSIENPAVSLPLREDGKFDVPNAVGKGEISVIKDLGLKYPYMGNCEISTGEISEDFAFYFLLSEQTPSAISSGVLLAADCAVNSAGAIIIRPLPDTSDDVLADVEKKAFEFKNISGMLTEHTPEIILKNVFSNAGLNITEILYPEYKCNCSRDRMNALLLSMNKNELYECLDAQGKLEIICHFCETHYIYTKEDIDKLLRAKTQEN